MSFGVADIDVEALRLLGHGLRFALLASLADHEQSVGELAVATGQSLSLVSQQLALLRKANLVQTRRDAKQIYYSLARDRISEIATLIATLAGESGKETAKADLAKPTSSPRQIGAAMFARVAPR